MDQMDSEIRWLPDGIRFQMADYPPDGGQNPMGQIARWQLMPDGVGNPMGQMESKIRWARWNQKSDGSDRQMGAAVFNVASELVQVLHSVTARLPDGSVRQIARWRK